MDKEKDHYKTQVAARPIKLTFFYSIKMLKLLIFISDHGRYIDDC